MTTNIATPPKLQFFNAAGVPLSGGKLYTYAAGTTTPLTSYTDSTGAVANSNPIILDSRGECSVWLSTDQYKFKLTDSNDVQIWIVDSVNGPNLPTLASLSASSGASLIGYLPNVSGSVATTVQNKLRQYVSIIDYGGDKTGVNDSTSAFNLAIAALPSTGGSIYFPAGQYKLTSTVTIADKCVSIFGDGSGQTITDSAANVSGSYLKFTGLGTTNGLVFDNVDGGFVRDIAIMCDSTSVPTGGTLVVYKGSTSGFYHATWTNVLCAGGYNGMQISNGFYFKAYSCIWKTFVGSQVLLLDGISDANDAQSCEFTNCTFGAETSTTTNLVVLDGKAVSAKFTSCSFLFGKYGVWMKNSTGGTDPNFLYIIGGGFENASSDCIRLDAGKKVFLSGIYASSDGARARLIYESSTFVGDLVVTGCYLRSGGRGGIWLENGSAAITGNTIINNNESSATTYTITNCANNGSGLIRVTTSTAHGYETNDMVTVSGVSGATQANGTWIITVISTTVFDLSIDANSDNGDPSAYSSAYTSGGSTQLASASVRVLSTGSFVSIVGNNVGGGPDGLKQTEYGIHSAGTYVQAMNNNCQSVVNSVYQSINNTRTNYGNYNVGTTNGSYMTTPYAVDGSFTYIMTGNVTTGVKNLNNVAYISGYKVRIVRATRVLSSVTSNQVSARLYVNGANIGTAAITQDGTTVTDTLFSTPLIIDGTLTPQRVQMNITAITGTPTDLVWDWQFQIIY